jgi:uncharacterized membrane protein YqaE (UPF0057 family)
MKKNLLLILVGTATLIFSSCAKKATTSFGYSKSKTQVTKVEKDEKNTLTECVDDQVLTSSTEKQGIEKPTISPEMKAEHQAFFDKLEASQQELEELKANTTLTVKAKKKAVKKIKKTLKADIKNEMKAAKASEASDDYILMMILGILIAPIGLGLTYGWGSTEMWIGLVLFLLFWLPGAIYGGYKVHKHFK